MHSTATQDAICRNWWWWLMGLQSFATRLLLCILICIFGECVLNAWVLNVRSQLFYFYHFDWERFAERTDTHTHEQRIIWINTQIFMQNAYMWIKGHSESFTFIPVTHSNANIEIKKKKKIKMYEYKLETKWRKNKNTNYAYNSTGQPQSSLRESDAHLQLSISPRFALISMQSS